MTQLKISHEEFQTRKREGDGICSLCHAWTLGRSDPDAEHGFCPECENHNLCGVNIARNLSLIRVG